MWELERLETEPWMEPPDPVLEAVAALVTADRPDLGRYGHGAGGGAPDRHEAQRPGYAAERPGREAGGGLPYPL